MDYYPIAAGHPSLIHHPTKRRHKPASKARRRDIIQIIRQSDYIGVRVGDRHILREGSPAGKAGLIFVVADMVFACLTLMAHAASFTERYRHPISHMPVSYPISHCSDHSGHFMPWYMGQLNRQIMAHPCLPVASADPVGSYLDDHPIVCWCRVRHVPYLQWCTKRVHDSGFHIASDKY